jgi:hypothetical protein
MKRVKKAGQQVASQIDAEACIRRGLLEAEKCMGRPADEVFDELEREGSPLSGDLDQGTILDRFLK